ncbi:MAG TPA: TolC family protein, partial [Candidatus Polarisedimenticolia bacterium]|nr:TolC family protein [Candidatus Polarisedimenticolia bacterium]
MLIRLLMGALAAQAADPPPLDLSALLREAEAAHPAIAAARSREAAARAAAVREGAPPDPIASIAYTNVGFGGGSLGDDEESVVELSWSQEWPYPGKLRLAGEAARLEAETLGHEAELARLEIAAGVKKAYTELWHADQTAAVLRESRELLSSLAETAQRRYETGEGLLENVLKAQTEIARLDAELQKAAQERRAAEALINT